MKEEEGRTATQARSTASDLGWHPLTRVLLAMQAATAIAIALVLWRSGLHVDWTDNGGSLIVTAGTGAAWAYFFWQPGNPREWHFAEGAAALTLLFLLSQICPLGQYAALALKFPAIDAWLAFADEKILHVYVPGIVAAFRPHPGVVRVLGWAYESLLFQFFLPCLVLPVLRDRDALWEYVFTFHMASICTLLALALVPAGCAFTYYGFESLIQQDRFLAHFNGIRSGTMTTIAVNDLEGLVSFPSFHAAGAFMATWAFRRHRWWLLPLIVVNVGLVVSTVATGAHYAIDVVGGAILVAACVAVYARWGRPRLSSRVVRPVSSGNLAADLL